MPLVDINFITKRRVFWLEKYILSQCWMKVVLVLLTKWEDYHWTKAREYIWHLNFSGYTYSLHQHLLEHLINDPSQILSPLLVP